MKKLYRAVVALTAAVHGAYLLYVPSGGFLALRWPRSLWLHVPAVVWGIGVVVLNWRCPLTALEEWARARADMTALPEAGFTEHYVEGVLYPSNRTAAAQGLAFAAAGVSWIRLASQQHRPASHAS